MFVPHAAQLAAVMCLALVVSSAYAQTCSYDGSDASVDISSGKGSDGRDVWKIQASGCPPWDWSKQSTPGTAEMMNWKATIPKNPVMSKDPIMINEVGNSVKGIVGMTLSGVAIFNALDANDRDAYIYEGKTMDECRGHVARTTYHVHTLPGACCAYTEKTADVHSPIWGVMADGIPIAGPHGDKGAFPTDLDECRGHVDETFKFYHYHTTGRLEYPYTANCLKGCVLYPFGNNMQLSKYVGECNAADEQYDYSSLDLKWNAVPVSMEAVDTCLYNYTLKEDQAPVLDMQPGGNDTNVAAQGGPSNGGGKRPPNGGGKRPPNGGGKRPPNGGGKRPPNGGGKRPPNGGGKRPPNGGGKRPPRGGQNTSRKML